MASAMWRRPVAPSDRLKVSPCRVGPGNFTLSPSQIPYVNLSIHTARVTARRLPPSAEPSGSSRFYPVGPSSTAMTCPLRSTSITLASTLLRGSPPLSGASVLSASRLEPLAPFPLASPARFSRSIQVAHRHYRPAANFALPTRRMPLGQYQDIHRADPGERVSPRF